MSTTLPDAPAGRVTCPDCRLGVEGPAAACPRCGAALPPPGAPVVWREGRHVVALRDSTLVDRCVRCGEPGDGRPIRHRVHWHHPALYILILWLIPYIVVALAVRRSATVGVSVCARHRRIRDRALRAAWALCAAGVAAIVAAAGLGSGLLAFGGCALLVLSPVVGMGGRRLVTAARIEDRLVRLRGADAAFRDRLPDWSAPGVAAPAPLPAPVAEGGTAALGHILAETWPELAADRARSAEYEWALDGLAPSLVAAVAASFAAERRPLPAPAVLRMAVMARARSEAAPPSGVRPSTVAWTPSPRPRGAGSRLRAGIPPLVAGAAAVAAFVASGAPWAEVRGPYVHRDYAGVDLDGGGLVALAALVALIACVTGAVLVARRSSARAVGACCAVASGAAVFGALGVLLAFGDIDQGRDQAATAAATTYFAGAHVSATAGPWAAAALNGLILVAGLYGWTAMRRRDEE